MIMERINFIKTLAKYARKICQERGYGFPQYAVCVAQACLESAYGTSTLMKKANAYFGIKANKTWLNKGGRIYNTKTKECYDGKTYTTITDSFRAYNSLEDSVKDYFDLISGKRYAKSLTAGTVKECITAIKEGGYATDPKYIDKIVSVYTSNKTAIDNVYYNKETTKKKTVEEVAMDVIAGKYGCGATRQLLLQRHGYDYVKVQSAVNKILKEGKRL